MVIKALQMLTMIVCVFALSLVDETPWLLTVAWFAAAIGLVTLTVFLSTTKDQNG